MEFRQRKMCNMTDDSVVWSSNSLWFDECPRKLHLKIVDAVECVLGKPDPGGAVLAEVVVGIRRCRAGGPLDVAAHGLESWIIRVRQDHYKGVSIAIP